jgi:hypothetical protein
MKKRGVEFSFAWIFSLIVGAVIIFLAIYGTGSFVKNERTIQDTESAKEFEILLRPVATGVESGKLSTITFPEISRVYNDCSDLRSFGQQEISVSQKSRIGEKWQDPGVGAKSFDKYLFSSEISEGEKFSVFSKPFKFPFKVADLIFMWSDEEEYCFVNPPTEVELEIDSLRPENIFIADSLEECSLKSKKVCFALAGCDIDVSLTSKSVRKEGESVFYEGPLIYGAIFSDPKIYECQVRRLMKRTSELSLVYLDKSNLLSPRGCSSNLESDLFIYSNATKIKDSSSLKVVASLANLMEDKNDKLSCRLF